MPHEEHDQHDREQHEHDHEHHEHHHQHQHEHHEHAFFGDMPGPRGRRGPRGRWGDFGGWGGGRRMRRGHIRTAILISLREEPAHGYEVMRRLEEMSGGLWRPSPGSVYPHLQMLEDEGLVRSTEVNGSRTYTLTDSGQEEARKATLPWQSGGQGDDQIRTLRMAVGQLMSAAKQLSGAGEASQVERGVAIINKARKELYQLLAED
jgi:DNA-binding PadR family transcriptional regulator